MWPVHTWLPDAHVEAPTGGSVVLAAIMLKMGGYGLLRFSLPIAPDASRELDWLIIAAVADRRGVHRVRGAGAAGHEEADRLLVDRAHGIRDAGLRSRLRHLAATGQPAAARRWACDGAMVQMISHGLISGALFLCVGVMYDRVHSREIAAYGGVINTMPMFAAFMVLFALSNAGLPGTSGFVGEFLVILASFKANFWYASRRHDAGARRGLHAVAGQARDLRPRCQRPRRGAAGPQRPRVPRAVSCWRSAVLVLGVWPRRSSR